MDKNQQELQQLHLRAMLGKPTFGHPLPTPTQLARQAKAARKAKYEANRKWYKGMDVLWAAIRLQDERLFYCHKCTRVIGWMHYSANHECGIVCSKHAHLEKVECAYWVDWKEQDVLEMADLEMPGTLWAE